MTLRNVRLILTREIRDQLRDRRTLFVIVVLPILLYPLLGFSLFQVAQFLREKSTRIAVIGAEYFSTDFQRQQGDEGRLTDDLVAEPGRAEPEGIASLPALFESNRFAAQWFSNAAETRLLELHFVSEQELSSSTQANPYELAQEMVRSGTYDAVLYFPADFAARLAAFRKTLSERSKANTTAAGKQSRLEVPNPEIIYNAAADKSQIAFARLSGVLRRWSQKIAEENIEVGGLSAQAVRPFVVGASDVAHAERREGAMWAKILPVLLLMWALTGAFYPAIDLCAGEKERGTLETLLSSPAERSEIVLGKLLTIMLFSILTAVLNLASVGLTGWLVLGRMPGFGLPPPAAMTALAISLIPMAALFSALCLALAAFARSSREGQYYLMPLLLITMPLVILPMSPGVELNLGNSLIPVTGVVLLLRSMLEGNYWQAMEFAPVVAAVTLAACMIAIRWAVDQFNSETVLFRESEQVNLGLWLWRLLRERRATPSSAAALFCGVLILVAYFFVSFSLTGESGLARFIRVALIIQVLVIAAPALLLTFLLTGNPRETLLLRLPPRFSLAAASLLAVALHPLVNRMQILVQQLYPLGNDVQPALSELQDTLRQADFLPLVLVIGLTPAICEELAFRGFILSGFRHLGRRWRAIIFSAVLFGLTHGILQQSLMAFFLGLVLGYLAIQTGSLLPPMVFHFFHNTLTLLNSRLMPDMLPDWRPLRWMVGCNEEGGGLFFWPSIILGTLVAVLLLRWFQKLPCQRSPEEVLSEAIERWEHSDEPLESLESASCGQTTIPPLGTDSTA